MQLQETPKCSEDRERSRDRDRAWRSRTVWRFGVAGVRAFPYKPELWHIEALHALLPETLNYKPGLGWCSASAKRLCSLHLRMNPFSYLMQ